MMLVAGGTRLVSRRAAGAQPKRTVVTVLGLAAPSPTRAPRRDVRLGRPAPSAQTVVPASAHKQTTPQLGSRP